jgi:hypothetical protein
MAKGSNDGRKMSDYLKCHSPFIEPHKDLLITIRTTPRCPQVLDSCSSITIATYSRQYRCAKI